MGDPDPDDVLVGRVVKPHGIRGELVVEVLSDAPGRFDTGVRLRAGRTELTIAASRPHQGRLLVAFEEVADRTAAERLRGRELHGPPIDLSDTDTYFAHELAGVPVRHGERDLGRVRDVIELPTAAGYDLLEVAREDGSTWLLPAVEDLVEVELDGDGAVAALLLIDPPEGLTDLLDE